MNWLDWTLWVVFISSSSYEIKTLLDTVPNNTISENVVKWCKRPLVPYLIGLLCGTMINYWTNKWCIAGLFFLSAHFVWQFEDEVLREWGFK